MAKKFSELAGQALVEATVAALKARNIGVHVAKTAAEAKDVALSFIPEGAEVLANSSVTVDQIGLGEAINDSGRFVSLKKKMYAMNRETQGREIAALVAAPQVAVGSVHAVSASGSLFIASMSGSNLPGYAYGAERVVLVISTKKIAENDADALERIWKHVLPLESVRARKAYNLPDSFNSNPNTILTINAQPAAGRLQVILVAEDLGF